jgi:hypothetical protein
MYIGILIINMHYQLIFFALSCAVVKYSKPIFIDEAIVIAVWNAVALPRAIVVA